MLNVLRAANTETQAKLAALDRSNAVIEFNLDGIILTANENFLQAIGYTRICRNFFFPVARVWPALAGEDEAGCSKAGNSIDR